MMLVHEKKTIQRQARAEKVVSEGEDGAERGKAGLTTG